MCVLVVVVDYFPAHESIFPSQHPKKLFCLILKQTSSVAHMLSYHCCGQPSFILVPKAEGETFRWLWHLLLEVIVVSKQQCICGKPSSSF